MDAIFSKKIISWRHIIAKWWLITSFSDVINVESWLEWVSKDNLDVELAELHGSEPDTCLDDGLASLEASSENGSLSLSDELVLERESVVSWVLEVWVDETVSNSHTLEVGLQLVLALEGEVVGDGWDVVTGV